MARVEDFFTHPLYQLFYCLRLYIYIYKPMHCTYIIYRLLYSWVLIMIRCILAEHMHRGCVHMISMTSLWPSAKRGTHTAAIAIGSGRWLVCITCYPRFLPDYLLYLMHTSLSIYPMFPQFMYISIYIYISCWKQICKTREQNWPSVVALRSDNWTPVGWCRYDLAYVSYKPGP